MTLQIYPNGGKVSWKERNWIDQFVALEVVEAKMQEGNALAVI
jgi:hypothetical protein